MPELPEVETVRRILEKDILGRTILDYKIIYPRLIQSSIEDFANIRDKKIIAISRKGKFLILNLSSNYSLLVHFRMEGKFFHLDSLDNVNKSTSLYFTLDNGTYLLFNDTRKFGVMYLKKDEELYVSKPLSSIGKEPWEIEDESYLLNRYKSINKPIKEVLLDQTIISGLGNIYADEVLFLSKINPFKKASKITKEEAKNILVNSEIVLKKAIELGGSTIKSYHPSKGVNGNFQNELLAYGREGKRCVNCNSKMEKRFVNGRGTTYCPKCQKVSYSIGLTGKIASGKSLVLLYLSELGVKTLSCDEEVKKLYLNKEFLASLEKKFKGTTKDGQLDKDYVTNKMIVDKKFARSYETLIWSNIKDVINSFLIANSESITCVEVPLLFESHLDKVFTFLVGVESSSQRDNLISRGEEDVDRKLDLNKRSLYDFNRHKLNYIIENDGSKEELKSKVKDIYLDILKK